MCVLAAFINERDWDGRTPLLWAIKRNNRTLVQWLIAHGARFPHKFLSIDLLRPEPKTLEWVVREYRGPDGLLSDSHVAFMFRRAMMLEMDEERAKVRVRVCVCAHALGCRAEV